MTRDELQEVLSKHVEWLLDNGGERADLMGADLMGADLRNSVLRGSVLRGSVLRDADLRNSDLRGADLMGAVLRDTDLRGSVLRGSVLRDADLMGADLRGADLRDTDLRNSDLRGADLMGADLRNSDLTGADLNGGKGIVKELHTPLMMLIDQTGPIRAYKMVDEDLNGPYYPSITYTMGSEIVVDDADTDDTRHCGSGISVATLDWCLAQWKPGYRVLVVEFTAADIACIPTATDGKFRLHRCRVVGEKDLSGLVPSNEETHK